MRKKVGLITWHYYCNFGSALQAYALQRSIEKEGYNVRILNYRNPKFGKQQKIRNYIRSFISNVVYSERSKSRRFYYPFLSFQRGYLNETRIVQTTEQLRKLCRTMDTVVCGSDQIWAPNVFNPIYFLDFVPHGVKKVAYASSIGLTEIPKYLFDSYQGLLSDFEAISVRETMGADLLQKCCALDAKVVADPTLLLERKEWESLERSVVSSNNRPFLFCYFLRKNNTYQMAVTRLAEELGLKIIGISADENNSNWMELLNNIGPREFLWLINHAEGVVTDSYHGTIFSLLYHKKFVCFERFAREDGICQNSRLDQLCNIFGIDSKIAPFGSESISFSDMDWIKFENLLNEYRQFSLAFLKSVL